MYDKRNVIRDVSFNTTLGIESREFEEWITMYIDDLSVGEVLDLNTAMTHFCLLYTSPSPRDLSTSRMPSSA